MVLISAKKNQEFVQVPTAKLKDRIAQLCKQYGLRFIETEESYTSQSSILDDDFLPTYGGEIPAGWKPSGKRGQKQKGVRHNLGRGGYQTAFGIRINSDCNGAINIIRKVATQLNLCLAKVGKAVLALPQRYNLDSLSRSYRKRSEAARLQLSCVTSF